jgi:hypothetical protein
MTDDEIKFERGTTQYIKHLDDSGYSLELVNQHNDKSCGRACVSMVTGIPYSELDIIFTGKRYNVISEVLSELIDCGIPVLVAASVGFFTEQTMIMAVPSLNHAGGMHWIVMHKGKVYDPQKGLPGKLYYDEVDNMPTGCGEIIIINPKHAEALIKLVKKETGLVTTVQ